MCDTPPNNQTPERLAIGDERPCRDQSVVTLCTTEAAIGRQLVPRLVDGGHAVVGNRGLILRRPRPGQDRSSPLEKPRSGDFKTALIYADYQPSQHEAELIQRAFGRMETSRGSYEISSAKACLARASCSGLKASRKATSEKSSFASTARSHFFSVSFSPSVAARPRGSSTRPSSRMRSWRSDSNLSLRSSPRPAP